jgi:hypothetical protein
MDNQELLAEEKIAKILVDHWIDFKGCKCHTFIVDDNIMKMKEFASERHKLLQQIPEFANSDYL